MLLSALEASLNRNLAASSAAQALCPKLEGKSLRLNLTGAPWPITLRMTQQQLRVQLQPDGDASASLSGSPIGLLSLALNAKASTLSGSSVQINGDAEVAQAFSELLKHARPDLEEELSRLVGDIPAHQLGNAARAMQRFGARFMQTLGDNVGEYLREESRDVAHRLEVDEFVRDVDTLRDDVERLAARLARLEQKKS